MTTVCLRSLFLLTCLALPAQQPTDPTAARAPGPVVTLSFAGGTLADFVAAVRRAEPRANIVVATEAAAARLPAIDLRGAGLEQALQSACSVAEGDTPVGVADWRGPGEAVYAVVVRPGMPNPTPAPAAAKDAAATAVFSLNRLLDVDPRAPGVAGLKVETVLSAIETGTADAGPAPVLRFHRESGLLFVRGTRSQLALIKDVLGNLERDLDERRRRALPAKADAETSPGKGEEPKGRDNR